MKAIAAAAFLAGCAAWSAPVRADTGAPTEQEAKQTWDEYKAKARKDLDVLEDKIAKLETQAKAAGDDARDRLQAQAQALREKKGEADREWAEFENATDDARRDLRVKFDRRMRELKRAVRKAEAKTKGT